jgi:hypothetical protein
MRYIWLLVFAVIAATEISAQTTSEILGRVTDESNSAVFGAKITARNAETGIVSTAASGESGHFRLPLLQPGRYSVSIEKVGFSTLAYDKVEIQLTEAANLSAQLRVSARQESVTVSGDVPLLNTTNAEVGVNFDAQRLRNLPLAPNSNLLNAALSVPGVSQLSGGNAAVAGGGVTFSVNGMRTRSNNFVVDGTDTNNSSIGGMVQEINNPDSVAEFRMITNQFSAEYGRAAGSLVSVVTKGGTNKVHGSAYWRHNDNVLNSRSNLDRRILARAPWRIENQVAGTLGGPIVKNKSFFFGSILRWTDRQYASGSSITGAPTETGKELLRPFAATRPALGALLAFLPAAQTSTGQTVSANIAGQRLLIPVGTLSGAEPALLNAWQWMGKGDHRYRDRHSLTFRVLHDARESVSGQSVPPGLTTRSPQKRLSANVGMTSTITPNLFNEFRAGFGRFVNSVVAADAQALTIPSIEVTQLGLTGFNAQNTRTAIGLAINNPQAAVYNNYQLQNNFAIFRGSHSVKAGIDFRRVEQHSDFNVTIRGRLQYQTLQDVVDDTPNVQTINSFLPGVPRWQAYRYVDYFLYLQDEWRVRRNVTLTYGVRYESPGNAIDS